MSYLFFIPVLETHADQATIEEKTPVSFDTVGSDYYNIRENKFKDLVSEEGKLELTFKGKANLEVKLDPSTSPGIDTDYLKLQLNHWNSSKWVGLSRDWQEIDSFEGGSSTTSKIVSYVLKYGLNEVDTPTPNRYTVNLEFRLTQTEGDDFNISVVLGQPGPGEWVRLRVTDENGEGVTGAKVEINGEFEGITWFGYKWVQFPKEGPATVVVRKGDREGSRKFVY